MKNTDEFYEDIEKNKKLINSREKKGYLNYANDLVEKNALVQLIGCHSFYLKSDLDAALEIQNPGSGKTPTTASSYSIAPNGNIVGPTQVPVLPGCSIKVPEWVMKEYTQWLNDSPDETIKNTKAFWATDTRIGLVIDKTNSEKEDYMEDYSRGEVVKVQWFENPESHFIGTWSTASDAFESISFHHVRNLRDITTDGPIEKKIYACNFGAGTSSYY